jgi:hypothetical protein
MDNSTEMMVPPSSPLMGNDSGIVMVPYIVKMVRLSFIPARHIKVGFSMESVIA